MARPYALPVCAATVQKGGTKNKAQCIWREQSFRARRGKTMNTPLAPLQNTAGFFPSRDVHADDGRSMFFPINQDLGKQKKPAALASGRLFHMAEREGFEPSVEYNPHTRLAGEHHRPLGHLSRKIGVYPGLVAEGVGFEPPVLAHNGFQDRRLQPLGHPSKRGCSYHFAQALSTRRPRSGAVQGKFMIHTGCAAAPCPCMPFDFAFFPDTDRVAARSD